MTFDRRPNPASEPNLAIRRRMPFDDHVTVTTHAGRLSMSRAQEPVTADWISSRGGQRSRSLFSPLLDRLSCSTERPAPTTGAEAVPYAREALTARYIEHL